VEGTWKSLEMWARERLGCFKQSFMGNSGGSSEDQDAYRNVDSKDWTHDFQVIMTFFGNLTGGHSCYILSKNLSTFCLCPETFNETESTSNGLINMAGEISRQHSIQAELYLLLTF
jgi:hypothetical protein